MELSWYAVYTRPRSEKSVSALLTQKRIENYLPLVKKLRLWSDRKKMVDFPLFPSYLFVKMDPRESYRAAQVPGVVRFISFDNKLTVVPEIQIEAIKRFVLTGEEFVEDEGSYRIGKRVRIARGGMKGLEGHLVEILGKRRVKVEIDSVRKSLYIKIPLSTLEIIGDSEPVKEAKYW